LHTTENYVTTFQMTHAIEKRSHNNDIINSRSNTQNIKNE